MIVQAIRKVCSSSNGVVIETCYGCWAITFWIREGVLEEEAWKTARAVRGGELAKRARKACYRRNFGPTLYLPFLHKVGTVSTVRLQIGKRSIVIVQPVAERNSPPNVMADAFLN